MVRGPFLLPLSSASFVSDFPGTFDGECSSGLERGLPAREAQGRDRGGEHHPKWEEEVRGGSGAARGPSAPGAQPPGTEKQPPDSSASRVRCPEPRLD